MRHVYFRRACLSTKFRFSRERRVEVLGKHKSREMKNGEKRKCEGAGKDGKSGERDGGKKRDMHRTRGAEEGDVYTGRK